MVKLNKKGFTLIETLSATVVVIPMIILIVEVVPNMARSMQTSKSTTIASHLSATTLEEIMHDVSVDSTAMATDYTEAATALTGIYAGYAQSISDSFDSNVKVVSVTVWRDLDADLVRDTTEPGFTSLTHITPY